MLVHISFLKEAEEFFPSTAVAVEAAKTPIFLISMETMTRRKTFLYSFHKSKYNKHLTKKLGQMEEYFSSKNPPNCQIWYFEKSEHKVNKI